MASTDIERLSIDTIRTLSMDAVQAANSGHPGLPMAMAPAAYLLYTRILEHNPGCQQVRVPLPPLVDTGNSRVVQLVEDVERELEVVVEQGRARQIDAGEANADLRLPTQRGKQTLPDRPARRRQRQAARVSARLGAPDAHESSGAGAGLESASRCPRSS